MNSTPRSACSSKPGRTVPSLSEPCSSVSAFASVSAPAISVTNGPDERGLSEWI
jgi:hypothetical protein